MNPSQSVTAKTGNLLPLSVDAGTPNRTLEPTGQQPTFANVLQRHAEPASRPVEDEPQAARARQEREPDRSDAAARERSPAAQRTRDARNGNRDTQRTSARQPDKAESADKAAQAEDHEDQAQDAQPADVAAAGGLNEWFAALASARPAAAAQAGAVAQGADTAAATSIKPDAASVQAVVPPTTEQAATAATAGDPAAAPRLSSAGADPAAAKSLAVDERSAQSAKQAATGADAVNMLGATADAAADGGQAAAGGRSFESALLAAQSAHQAGGIHAGRQADAAVSGHVETPVGTPGFADALGEQVRMLVSQAAGRAEGATLHEAKLSLNPAELGPITIRIALEGQQAQVEFTAASETTRRAIEDSLPQLAGALQGEGLTLTGGGVYDQRQQAGQPGAQGEGTGTRAGSFGIQAPAGMNDSVGAAAPAARRSQGVVDLYA